MSVRLIEEAPGAVPRIQDLADGSTVRVRRRIDGTDVFIDPPKPTQGSGDFAAQVADAVGQASASKSAFPLDAEQIVRLAGAVLTRVLNASRPADSRAVEEEELTVALGEAAGVPLPIARNEWGILRLRPYGAVTAPTKDEPASQQPGGSREG